MFAFRSRAILALVAAVAGHALPASAQSCAMCYTSAASSGQGAIAALQHGILILLCPPLLMFAGICVLAIRSRDRFK